MRRARRGERGWKDDLGAFFETRSQDVRGRPLSQTELCWVSGREPRLWSDRALYEDLMAALAADLDLHADQRLLEMGCAAGFLAKGLAPRVGRYTGLDFSRTAVHVARSLGLPNAAFVQADGASLPFSAGIFDRVISYDVFTNFAEWTTAEAIVTEMVRVVRPGGRVMVGSLGDEETRQDFERIAQEVGRDLDARQGPLSPPQPAPLLVRAWRWWHRPSPGRIVCYFFKRRDFVDLGVRLGAETRITELHARNPYRGYRFNVIYTKRGR